MARPPDPRKVMEWQRPLRRIEKSGLTTARFCESEGVSTASFYCWRKRLVQRSRQADLPSSSKQFMPLRLVTSATIGAHVPGGTRLEIPLGDPAALKMAIEALAAADARRSRGGEPC